MNELLSRLALLSGGVTLFAGGFHLLHYLRAGRRRTDFLFALVCLPAAAYAFVCSGLYLAPSPAEGAAWAWADRGLVAFFLAASAAVAAAPSSWLWTGSPAVKRVLLPGGLEAVYQEAGAGWFPDLAVGGAGLLAMAYVAVALFRALGGGRRGTIVPVLLGTLVLSAAELNDLLVILGAYRFLYLTEFGFLAWVLGMAVALGEGHRVTYRALERKEATQRALLAAIPDAVFRIRRDGTVTDYRPGGGVTPFVPPEAFLGRSAFEVLPPGPAGVLRAAMEEGFRTGETQVFEYALPFPEGERRFEGRMAGVGQEEAILFARDITARREAERAVAESEELFRTLFDTSPDQVALETIPDGRFVQVNQRFLLGVGKSREEMLGRSAEELGISAQDDIRDRMRSALGERGVMENMAVGFRSASGELRAGLMSAKVVTAGGKPHLLTIVRDVTERLRADEAVAESEERFRTIFQTSPDVMTISTIPEIRYVDLNQAFYRYTGLTPEQALGKTAVELDLFVDLADRDRLHRELAEKGEARNLETRFRVRGGGVGVGLMSSKVVRFQGKPHLLTTIHDIGPLKEAEDRLRRSLREKEVLLQEIHHRVKNNLHVISGLLDVQAHHITDPAGREVYRESRNRVLTMALIHQKLYESHDLEQVDFGAYLGSLAQALDASSGSGNVRLALELASAPMVVDTAIPCGLIANELISNAFKHGFPGGRRGTVAIRFRAVGEGRFLLEVEDDGAGLPPGFDPARTTSLGLKLVTMLVSQLGGTLSFGAGRERGALFSVGFSEYREAGTLLHPPPPGSNEEP